MDNVDYSAALEAVYVDGQVGKVEPHCLMRLHGSHFAGLAGAGLREARYGHWDAHGKPIGSSYNPWTLRNIIPAKPSTPSNGELTQRMEIAQADALVLLRKWTSRVVGDAEAFVLASQLVAVAGEPEKQVDPDLTQARQMAARDAESGTSRAGQVDDYRSGRADLSDAVQHRLAGIKRGRFLEAAEAQIPGKRGDGDPANRSARA